MRPSSPSSASSDAPPAPPAPSANSTRTLERGLSILDCYDVDHWGWTLSDICRQTGLPKATVFRLLKTLESRHYLILDPLTNRYCLGPSMLKAASMVVSHSELVRQARPLLESLTEATGETAVLTAWAAQRSLTLDYVLTPRPFKPYVTAGQMLSDLNNAHTQVFLAFMPVDESSRVLARLVTVPGDGTAVDFRKLEQRLAEVRRVGLAYDVERRIKGISAVAAPAFDASGQVRASVGVIAPAERFAVDGPLYTAPLKAAARQLSHELGYVPGVA